MEISEFFPFWKKLTSQEQQLLEESTAVRTYEKGEIIHDGSRDCTGLLLLTEGQMRAYTVTEEGRELTLFRLFPGDVCMFSGYCAVSSVPFPVTVEAWEPTRVLVIPSAVYRGLMDTSLPVARFTSDMMAARLSEMMWLMDQILSRGMDSRLAALLLILALGCLAAAWYYTGGDLEALPEMLGLREFNHSGASLMQILVPGV